MGMLEVFNAFEQTLAANLTALALPVPKFRTGADQVTVAGAPPQIVWVPTSGPVRGRDSTGADGVRNPRQLFKRLLGVDCYVWGSVPNATDPKQHYGATEALVNHLVAAMYGTLWGSVNVVREDWQTAAAASGKLGVCCVLGIVIDLTFTRELDQYATVTSLPITIPDPMEVA